MRHTSSLPAVGIAAVLALGALAAVPASATAADPVPSPSPIASDPPGPGPSPSAAPSPTPSEEPPPSGEPTPAPEPTPTPAPDPSPSADPSADASPAPTVDPTPEPTVVPTRVQLLREQYVLAARVAVRQRDDRYVRGASGPNAFDCSGLVRYAYRKAGISRRLGGGHSARAMLEWARKHDRTRKRHPRVGDVVIWGNGRHAGIYIGNGRAISALNPRQDIRITRIHALSDPFTTFIRTRP